MKKSKRLLALLLSVMLIVGVVFSVPFTVSAKTIEIEETGVSSLKFNTLNILGGEVEAGKDYYSISDPDAKSEKPVYAWFDAEEAGYYILSVTNNHMTEGKQKLTIGFADHSDKDLGTMTVADGETQELSIKADKPDRYYIKLKYTFTEACYGGNIGLKLTAIADAEPDEIGNKITVKPEVFADGSIDVKGDKDWFFVQTANNKKYSITLENRNEETTAFKAEVYDSKGTLVGTVTTETEKLVTLELSKPKDTVSYNVCVTGLNDEVLGKYGFYMSEVKPVATEVPLNEEFYDSIAGYQTEGSKDYLKFTTIDKDAYYTITVKNINIETHSWAADNEVQIPLVNINDEELSRVYLTEGQEKSMTKKLAPNTTYYLYVFNNYLPDTNGGNYKVQISYVLDPDKNEMENATQWELEEKYYGDLAAGGDSDWFKITTNEETDYTFTLKNTNIPTHSWASDHQFRGVIYNDKKESLTQVILTADKEGSSRITLEPNTEYYIAIWDPDNTTGEYNFDLSVTVIIDEEAVGMANAVELKYNEEYYDSITNWDGDNKVDYLKFTTLNEPAYYTLTAKNINIPTHSWSGDHQVQFIIWNEHKEELGRICRAEGAEDSITLMLDKNTTYYIRINNNENNGGNYKVNLSYVLDPEANSIEQGKTLRIAERYYGNIAASGDKDYFKITTTDKTDYILYLKNINIPTHSWSGDYQFRVVLYNKYSENLGEILATNGNEGNISITLEPNTTYYLGVWDPDNTTGEYNVILSDGMLLGDVTLDDKVNIKDATAIQKNLAKLLELDSKQMTAADVTADGKVNIKDATAIQKFLAKIETEYKTGQLILNEIKYDEPATEATQPSNVVLTEPVTTTAVQEVTTEATESSEAVSTTAPQVTDPEEVPVTTIATEPTETTTAEPEDTTPVESTPAESEPESEVTEPTEEVYLTQLDELKALNEKAYKLLEDYKEYEDEHPLKSNSVEIKLKRAMGYEDDGNEWITEHEKFFRSNDRVTYFLMHGYQYVDDYTEYITGLKSAIEWFEYYVTEVHPEPVLGDRIIYFENNFDWASPNIYFWNSAVGDGDKLWPGEKMIERIDGLYYYEIPRDCDIIVFNSTENYQYYSVQIDLTKHEDAEGFRLIDEFNNGYSYEEIKEVNPRPDF